MRRDMTLLSTTFYIVGGSENYMHVTRDSLDKTENMIVCSQKVTVLTGREFITSLK
jgi:hypothetical protein